MTCGTTDSWMEHFIRNCRSKYFEKNPITGSCTSYVCWTSMRAYEANDKISLIWSNSGIRFLNHEIRSWRDEISMRLTVNFISYMTMWALSFMNSIHHHDVTHSPWHRSVAGHLLLPLETSSKCFRFQNFKTARRKMQTWKQLKEPKHPSKH